MMATSNQIQTVTVARVELLELAAAAALSVRAVTGASASITLAA